MRLVKLFPVQAWRDQRFRTAVAGAIIALVLGLAACAGSTPEPTPTPTLAPTPRPSPTPEVACVPWQEAPEHLEEETCVEGRIYWVRRANQPYFAFFFFDPSVRHRIDYCCGDFYAWVRCDDWCEYFSSCSLLSGELDGACVRVFGTIAKSMGRVRIVVNDRSQIEIISCEDCQHPEACAPYDQ